MAGRAVNSNGTYIEHTAERCLFAYSDLRKLQRDYPAVDSQRMIDSCTDLGPWCNSVCNTGGRWSMERLVMYLVSGRTFDASRYALEYSDLVFCPSAIV